MIDDKILWTDPKRCYDFSQKLLRLGTREVDKELKSFLLDRAKAYERAAWELAGYKESRHEDKDVEDERAEGWDYGRLDL